MLHKSREDIPQWNSLDRRFPAATTIMIPAARWASTAACNVSTEQPLSRPATAPGVVSDVRSFGRVALAWIAAHRVRRQEKFHALDGMWPVCRQPSCVYHTAGDPLCAGRHPDLVASTVVADLSASGVAAVTVVVARHRRVVAARVADAVMNGVMPVVIVVGGLSVPAAVVRLKRVMRPANTGIGASNHNSLAGETELPDLRRVRVIDSWFDRLRYPRLRRRFSYRIRLRKVNCERADCLLPAPRRGGLRGPLRSRGCLSPTLR